MTYYILYTILITIIHAKLDAIKIKKNEYLDKIWRTSVWYFGCILPIPFIDPIYGLFGIWAGITPIVTRMALFDYALNHFRNKPLSSVSETTSSVIDKFEQKLGINENLFRMIGGGLLILNIIYSLHNPLK